MAWVETRITRTTQPQDGCGVDWTHPLASKLIFLYNGATPHGPKDAMGNAVSPSNLTLRVGQSGEGVGAATNAGTGIVSLPATDRFRLVGTNKTLFGFWDWHPTEVGNQHIWSVRDGSTQVNFWNFDNSGSHVVNLLANGTNHLSATPSKGITGYTRHAVVHNDATAQVSFYWDGGEKQSVAQSANFGSSSITPALFNRQSGGRAFAGTMYMLCAFDAALSDAEIKSLSDNPWQLFEPEVQRIWVDDYVFAGGAATVIPIGVQATGSVGTPSATGAARATPAGVSASSAVGTPVAVGGTSIPATALPAGVQATAAIGTVTARGAAVALPAGVTATGAVGTPSAVAGTSIPATVLPAGVQASSAVGTPTAKGAAIAQPLGVAAIAYVGTPTIATGVSGVAVAYPAGVQAIGQVGTLIATGAAWTAAVGVQAVASVGTPTAYAGEIVIYVAGAQTRPSRLQSSGRASRIQTGTRASR